MQLRYRELGPLHAPSPFLGKLLREMQCEWLLPSCVLEGFVHAPQGEPLLQVVALLTLPPAEAQSLCDSPSQVGV